MLLLGLPPAGLDVRAARPTCSSTTTSRSRRASATRRRAWSRVVAAAQRAAASGPGGSSRTASRSRDYGEAFAALAHADGPRGKVMLELTSRPPSR